MKHVRSFVGVVLAICLLCCTLGGCTLFKSDEELIRDRLGHFVFALNAGDLEGAMECLDARSRNTYSAAISVGESLVGSLTGFDISMSDMFALSMGFMPQDFMSMKIESVSITTDTVATVYLSMGVSNSDLQVDESVENMPVEMIKEEGDWYINAQLDFSSML